MTEAGTDNQQIIIWKEEVAAVINDIKNHVKEVIISDEIKSSNTEVYFNLETLENNRYLIKLSSEGFAIVGTNYNTINIDVDVDEAKYYQTPYSLLSDISKKYVDSFGYNLIDSLNALADK